MHFCWEVSKVDDRKKVKRDQSNQVRERSPQEHASFCFAHGKEHADTSLVFLLPFVKEKSINRDELAMQKLFFFWFPFVARQEALCLSGIL